MQVIFLFLLIIFAVDYLFFRFDSAQVQFFVGFRTPSAYKSKENWEHAQRIGYKLMFFFCVLFAILNYFILIPNWLDSSFVAFITVIVLVTIEYKLR